MELDLPEVMQRTVHGDNRGFFVEVNRHVWVPDLIQTNVLKCLKNTLRGFHYRIGSGSQKLVTCISGKIQDVAVDLRKESDKFGRWYGYVLDGPHRSILVPAGFGHAIEALEDSMVLYQTDQYFDDLKEFAFDAYDPQVGVDWLVPRGEHIRSKKDTEGVLRLKDFV